MGWSGPVTHRQYRVWQAWFSLQLDSPSKQDHYMMQLTCEVRRAAAAHPNKYRPEQFRIRFGANKPSRSPHETALTKSRWVSMMGMPVTVIKPPLDSASGQTGEVSNAFDYGTGDTSNQADG